MSRCQVAKSMLSCTFSRRVGTDIPAGVERRADTQLYSNYHLVVLTIVVPVLFGWFVQCK
jgi:hypothetical protein